MGADPSNIKPKTKSAYAIFEFDLPYISIPRYVFKSVKSKFENQFNELEAFCDDLKCSTKSDCNTTLQTLKTFAKSVNQRRLNIQIGRISYFVTDKELFSDRIKDGIKLCDFLIQGHR